MARTKGDYARRIIDCYRVHVASQEMTDRKKHPEVFWEQLHQFHCARVHFFAEQLGAAPRSARVHEKLAWQEIETPPAFRVFDKANSIHLALYRQLNEQFEKKRNALVENKNKAERVHTFYCSRVKALESASDEEIQACINNEQLCEPNLNEYLKDYDCNGIPHWAFGIEDLLSEEESD